MCIFAERKNVP
jgi:hypothetical protein